MTSSSSGKKVAVVSCYHHHNYGSVLQAYATQKALDKLGYQNETVNISEFEKELSRAKTAYFIKAALSSDILIQKLGMSKSAIRRKLRIGSYSKQMRIRSESIAAFRNKYFRLSEKYFSMAELTRKCAEKYDAVLVGSDQLWTPANIAADYYTLSFVPNGVNTVSYATSFGQSILPNASAEKAKIFLDRIRHIGVREESGKRLVEDLTGRRVPIVCDPTLLLTEDDWSDIKSTTPIALGKYILCYYLGTNRIHREFAERLRQETGYRIVSLPHLDEYVKWDEGYADELLYDISPADFLNLVKNAAYVCTDSYHCTVFSALYRRTSFTLRRYSEKTSYSTNDRLDTLLGMLGLKERLITGDEDIADLLGMKIDFDNVDKNIASARARSLDYLTVALGEEIKTDG